MTKSDERSHLDGIRRFFLQPQKTYSTSELAALWGVPEEDVYAVFHDELERSTPSACIGWESAVGASVRFSMLRPLDIEHALGPDFVRVRTGGWRTVPILVHVPAFVVDALLCEPSLPPDLPIDVRIEQLLVEVFASS